MKIFYKVDGEKIIDIVGYIRKTLDKNPDCEVHIGTDSQNHRKHTMYVIVIAFRYGTRGVHFIKHKETVSKIRDRKVRLMREAELSIMLAEWIKQKMNVDIQIDMDYNSDPKFKSNEIIEAAAGWAKGLGYKVNLKPNNQIATKAADQYC